MPKSNWRRLLLEGKDAGSAAIGSTDLYYCPICAKAFPVTTATTNELTREHVPPRAVGGREIILTCRPCNNRAGSTVDAAAAKRAQLKGLSDLISGKREDGVFPIVFTAPDGTELNARVSRDQSGLKFRIPQTVNNPQKILQSEEKSKELMSLNGGLTFRVRSEFRFSGRSAKISHLRSAFLVATAKFGYTFAFSKSLEDVRRQILQPDKEIFSIPCVHIYENSLGRLLVSQELNALLIAIEDRILALPLPGTSTSTWSKTRSKISLGKKFNIQAKPFPWPTRFEALLDHSRTSPNPRLLPE